MISTSIQNNNKLLCIKYNILSSIQPNSELFVIIGDIKSNLWGSSKL